MSEKKDEISTARDPSVDEGNMAAEKQMRDIGADLYLEVRQYSREELDAERKIVLRKIDWIIMPMVRVHSSWLRLIPII
jgi:hypothetical protein